MDVGQALSGSVFWITLIILIVYMGFCLWMGIKGNQGHTSVKEYFISNKNVGMFFLFFTCWGSFCGAGNFVGFAGSAAANGYGAYWAYAGDAILGYLVFSWWMAPKLAKYDYYTMPQYIANHLCGNDLTVRRIGGIAAALCNIAITGNQMKGLSYLFHIFLGVPRIPALLIAAVILIVYTGLGGMSAVVKTDAVQGILQVIGTILTVSFGIGLMTSFPGGLVNGLEAVDPGLVSSVWGKMTARACISGFLTGFFGDLCNPIMWNRAFIAKDTKTANICFKLATIAGIVSTGLVMTLGLVGRAFNPEVGDWATYWVILNKMPFFMVPLMALCFAGAIMSTADTHLNAGVANVVCDVIDPEEKMSVEKTISVSKIATYVCGAIGMIGAAFFPSIITISFFGLTIAGATIFPVYFIGNRLRSKEPESKGFTSNISIRAARYAMIVGAIVSIIFDQAPVIKTWMGGGIIPGFVSTFVILWIGCKVFKPEYPIGGKPLTEGYVNHECE